MTGVCLFVCVVGPGFDSTSPAFVVWLTVSSAADMSTKAVPVIMLSW